MLILERRFDDHKDTIIIGQRGEIVFKIVKRTPEGRVSCSVTTPSDYYVLPESTYNDFRSAGEFLRDHTELGDCTNKRFHPYELIPGRSPDNPGIVIIPEIKHYGTMIKVKLLDICEKNNKLWILVGVEAPKIVPIWRSELVASKQHQEERLANLSLPTKIPRDRRRSMSYFGYRHR